MIFESEFAEKVFRSKYLSENETDPYQAVERIVKSVAGIYPEIEEEAREYINKQWFIPAGGVWRASGTSHKNVSHVNCTTLTPVEDNLESIFDSLYKWGKYAAFGQGIGLDISNLRPRGSKVHNSSRTSTGSVSFMNLYDAVLKVISQNGRRGASLLSIKDTHPDLEEFISVKDKSENDKSRIDTANISIQTSDAFMEAVKNDSDWELSYENKYEKIIKTVRARDIFDKICQMAWKRGDPGLQFIDKARRESNSDSFGFDIKSTNACSEQWLDSENSCNLSHINLAKYAEYGKEGYTKLIRFGIYFINAVRMNEINENRSPTQLQRDKIINMPRTGLGVTGLADYFIDNKIVYGSDESVASAGSLFMQLAKVSYETGYELGKKYGSFPNYSKEKMLQSEFVKRILPLVHKDTFDYQINVCYNTIAPVGTGQIISNGGGAGIEPIYSKYMVRRERATTTDWKEWFNFNPYIERYLKSHDMEITRENADSLSSSEWVMSYGVNPMAKMKLVSETQKWIDSAISVTFNLPEDATVEDIEHIYMEAWKQQLKGITVYRENSLSGVLITEQNYNKQIQDKAKAAKKHDDDYEPRPKSLPCDIYNSKYRDQELLVLVGLKDEKPYEVFVTPNNHKEFDTEKYKKGFIVKQKSGHYDLIVENGEVRTMISNIGQSFDSTYGTLSRMVSMSLRHNVPTKFVVDQLNKDSGFIAYEKVLSRTLKKYIRDEETSRKVCPECGSTLVYKDGCVSCPNGDYSKCD